MVDLSIFFCMFTRGSNSYQVVGKLHRLGLHGLQPTCLQGSEAWNWAPGLEIWMNIYEWLWMKVDLEMSTGEPRWKSIWKWMFLTWSAGIWMDYDGFLWHTPFIFDAGWITTIYTNQCLQLDVPGIATRLATRFSACFVVGFPSSDFWCLVPVSQIFASFSLFSASFSWLQKNSGKIWQDNSLQYHYWLVVWNMFYFSIYWE